MSKLPAAPACVVTGEQWLPAKSGGRAALCSAIAAAARGRLAGAKRIEVQAGKRGSLEGVVVMADGRRLPPLSFDQSDAPLSAASYRTFAADLVRFAAGHARR